MDDLIGKELGPYRILEQIGTGGMATVYKAYHPATDRYVAVKVLSERMSQGGELRKRFQREAKVITKLEHAHILPVYDSGEAEDRLHLVMRYVEAGTLKDRLAEGPLDLDEVNRIFHQVGGALEYAHRLDVVHRDVKPSNVLVDDQGNCYLTDFGLARIMESSVRLTATGVGVGTPAYMSPEQGKGEKVDARSDIYSLGVMLYEMATGRVPYEAETPMAVVLKHISAPLPLPSSVNPNVPVEVERVILKAMAKDPEDRFQTVAQMAAALDTAVRLAQAEAPAKTVPGKPAAAKEIQSRDKGFLAQAAAGLQEVGQTGWGRAALWTAVGIVALLAFYLVLSRVPLKVQIRGGQLEVLRIAEATTTPSGVVAVETATKALADRVTATNTPWLTATPSATPTSQPTATASPTIATAAEPTATPTSTPARPPVPTEAPQTEAFLPVAINALAIDPNDPDTVFAGTYGAGIYTSHDGGQTWTPSNEGLRKGTVGSIVVDPNDSSVVYAGLFEQGGVYKSTDGGQTWVPANQGIDLDAAWDHTGLVYLDPADSSRLYYSGTTNGLYHSDDGGATWQQRSHAGPAVTGLVIDPGDSEHLYVSAYRDLGASDLTGAGVYESHDGGRTWQLLTNEEMTAPGGDFWHLAIEPQDFSTLYAGGRRGAYKTSDGGRSWTPILDQSCDWLAASEVAVYCGAGDNLFISGDDGQSWKEVSDTVGWRGPESLHFAIDPGDPQTLYGGTNAVMKSTDGGWTWTYVGQLGAAARMRLTVDPRDGSRLFLSGVDYVDKVFRSEDGGRTWQVVATCGGWRSRITIDPARDVIYLPNVYDSGDLYRSTDNGQTWERFGSVDITGGPWQMVPDPRDAKKLWLVGECGARPSLSKDGGETFMMVESFPEIVCHPILLVHGDSQRMYIVAWEGFYRSDDGGENWRSLGGLGGIYRAAVLDPSNADVVYIGSTHKGVLKTEDGGLSWRQVNAGLTNPSINELAIDPAHPQTIYAATDGGAFVSADGGKHWSPVQEELGPNPIVYSIAVDANDSSKVYAVTPNGIFQLEGAQPEAAAAPTPAPVASFSGRVTDAATGQGVAGAKVEVRPEGGWAPEDRWPYPITTDADGHYALFNLEAGDYVLRVTAAGYAREYYDNVLPSHEARPVHVAARRETSGVDFRLNQGGSISGHVYRSDGVTPIGGAAVFVRPSKYRGDHGFWAFTDGNGAYTVQSLPLGRYKVTARAAGYVRLVQFYGGVYGWNNAPDVVVTPPGDVPGIDILMDRAGSISGRVYASDGVTPIPHVSVWADMVDGEFSEGFEGSSDQNGRYLITGIPPGTFTARTENIMRYANEYYDAKPTGRAADLIVVREGETTSNINFSLDESGSITGRVYDQETGEPVQHIDVVACLPDGDCSVPAIGTSTYDGSFKLLLRPGLYFIRTGPDADSMLGGKYVSEWYDDVYDMRGAKLLEVTLGQETSGIDLYLARSGSISGHVYDENGAPIGDATVYAFSDVYPGNGANTQADGSYRIEGLLSGAYVVQVTVSGYVSEYHNDVTDPALATRANVNAPDDTPDIDFVLSRTASYIPWRQTSFRQVT